MNRRQRNAWIEAAKEQVLRNATASDSCEAELMMLYDECANQLETEIQAFFQRYASENKLTDAEASKLLSGKEYNRWRKSIAGYLKEIDEAGKDSKIALELHTLAVKTELSRKERLLTNIYYNMAKTAGKAESELSELLEGLIRTNYERKSYDIQNIGGSFFHVGKIDEKLLKQVLKHPWSGKNYSAALWDNTDKLAALTKRELTLGFMSGASIDKIAKEIDDIMGKGMNAARRLVRTESNYFANQGQLLAYREAGITRYRYLGGGCDVCVRLNGLEYSIDEAKVGENFPPMHPNCKCTTVAAFDLPLFKKRTGDVLQDNPKFEEWKRRQEKGEYENLLDETGDAKSFFGKLTKNAKAKKDAINILKPYADEVLVSGEVNVKNYRKAAIEIARQMDELKLDKLKRIEIFPEEKAPQTLGKTNGTVLKLSTKLLDDPDRVYKTAIEEWKKNKSERLLKVEQELQFHERTLELEKIYSKLLESSKYDRHNVIYEGKVIESVIQHEFMHVAVLKKKLINDIDIQECYNKAKMTGDIYKISRRASKTQDEFIAEAGVMFLMGEPLPEYIETLIRRIRNA